MRVDLLLGPRQPRPIDDAGVVQFVADDNIFLAQQRRHGSRIRGESGLVEQGGLSALEARQFLFQFLMDGHVAGDRPNRAGPHTQFINRAPCGSLQPGMVRQTEVVVGGEVDDLAAVVPGHRLLRSFSSRGQRNNPFSRRSLSSPSRYARGLVMVCSSPNSERRAQNAEDLWSHPDSILPAAFCHLRSTAWRAYT